MSAATPDGWHVIKDNGAKPWVIAIYRGGKVKRVAARFETREEAHDTVSEWLHEQEQENSERDDTPSLCSHGPWGAP